MFVDSAVSQTSVSHVRTSVAGPGSVAFLTPGSGIWDEFFPVPGSKTHIFESLFKKFFA